MNADFIIESFIANGKFSKIYLAVNHEREHLVVKQFNLSLIPSDNLMLIQKEVDVISLIDFKYIVKCLGIHKVECYIYLKLEFCEFGDLLSLLNYNKKEGKIFTERNLLIWLFHILESLAYIHDLGIVHRDIEPENILLKKDDASTVPKLTDFSLSYQFKSIGDGINTFTGKPLYMAPEIFKKEYYNVNVDIWSLGITIIELCNMAHPYNYETIDAVKYHILSNNVPIISSNFTEDFKKMIYLMVTKDPLIRPNASDLLKKRFFAQYNLSPIYNRHITNKYVRSKSSTKHNCHTDDHVNSSSNSTTQNSPYHNPSLNDDTKLNNNLFNKARKPKKSEIQSVSGHNNISVTRSINNSNRISGASNCSTSYRKMRPSKSKSTKKSFASLSLSRNSSNHYNNINTNSHTPKRSCDLLANSTSKLNLESQNSLSLHNTNNINIYNNTICHMMNNRSNNITNNISGDSNNNNDNHGQHCPNINNKAMILNDRDNSLMKPNSSHQNIRRRSKLMNCYSKDSVNGKSDPTKYKSTSSSLNNKLSKKTILKTNSSKVCQNKSRNSFLKHSSDSINSISMSNINSISSNKSKSSKTNKSIPCKITKIKNISSIKPRYKVNSVQSLNSTVTAPNIAYHIPVKRQSKRSQSPYDKTRARSLSNNRK